MNTAAFIALFAAACGLFTMFISIYAANVARKKKENKGKDQE